MTTRFAKYEGLGNDFVVIDAEGLSLDALTPEWGRVICDRHRGVGADGVLWVDRARLAEGAVRLVIANADGTRPEMCGNGVRCVVRWLADEGAITAGATVTVETDAGPRAATLEADGSVTVDMGVATVREQTAAVHLADGIQAVEVVDVGNPHAVVFSPKGDAMTLVGAVRMLPEYPRGVNVELVSRRDEGGFRVRVNERGVGWTLACGTGACAVVAAAVRRGRAREDHPVEVELDGGVLSITVEESSGRVWMRGPARRVFTGEL